MNCRLIANGALRKIGVLAAGREARPNDLNDTFDALVNLYRQLINNGAFGRLCDVIPTADYTACGNERIFRNSAATTSITLPETISNAWAYCDCCIYGRYPCEPVPMTLNPINRDVTTPRDCSVVSIIDADSGNVLDFIYDGQSKAWTGISALTLDDEAPLSARDSQGLQALLATKIADEYPNELRGETIRLATDYLTGLTQRRSAPRELACTEYF